MLRIVVLSAMVLQSVGADARAVEVLTPRLVMVKEEAELRRRCGVNVRIDGCTRFTAYALSATCSRAEKGWSMTAFARFRPYYILRRRSVLTHEMLHVRDIETSIADLLHQLQRTSFETRESCEDVAARAIAGFPRQLERFIQASSEKLD